MKLWAVLLVTVLSLSSLDSFAAKRLGGGKSFGQQSSNVSQREVARPAPTAPVQQAAPVQPAPMAAPPVAPPQRSPWGGMLGGLAAGLGLAWLAHSLGFGAEFGSLLLMGVVLLLVFAVIGALRRRPPAVDDRSPYAFEGAGVSGDPRVLPLYNPHNVGNDASARPMDTDPGYASTAERSGALIGTGIGRTNTWHVPADFDSVGFVQAAKENFVLLQKAWDRADIPLLRTMMTDAMVEEIRTQLAEREAHAGGQPNHTDVVMLEAQLLGIEDLNNFYMASVEFSGMIREEPSAGPTPFREVWNMTKPKDGSTGWLVAGVQALE